MSPTLLSKWSLEFKGLHESYIWIIIGGVEYYSENIIKRADVVCSVMTEQTIHCTGCSVPLKYGVKIPNQ